MLVGEEWVALLLVMHGAIVDVRWSVLQAMRSTSTSIDARNDGGSRFRLKRFLNDWAQDLTQKLSEIWQFFGMTLDAYPRPWRFSSGSSYNFLNNVLKEVLGYRDMIPQEERGVLLSLHSSAVGEGVGYLVHERHLAHLNFQQPRVTRTSDYMWHVLGGFLESTTYDRSGCFASPQ